MKPARNLWPIGIIVVCALFVAGTATLIVVACSQHTDLVTPDYYEQELRFQGHIDRVQRTRSSAPQASVAYNAAAQSITVSLPPAQVRPPVTGRIELYRPSAAGLDRAINLEPDARGIQRLDASGLAPGLWKVRVSWTAAEQTYYLEQKVVVGPRPSWPEHSASR
jgi:hypothetical protein